MSTVGKPFGGGSSPASVSPRDQYINAAQGVYGATEALNVAARQQAQNHALAQMINSSGVTNVMQANQPSLHTTTRMRSDIRSIVNGFIITSHDGKEIFCKTLEEIGAQVVSLYAAYMLDQS